MITLGKKKRRKRGIKMETGNEVSERKEWLRKKCVRKGGGSERELGNRVSARMEKIVNGM